MKALIQALRRAISTEPAPWLFAGSVLLAVALWRLPVPAFIFAQAASTSAQNCACAIDNCKSWSVATQPENPCDDGVWEECKKDLEWKIDCAPPSSDPEKKMPKSKFIYDKGPSTNIWCNNTAAHDQDTENPEDKDDAIKWFRDDVTNNSSGSTGTKKIEFKPKLSAEFIGFANANVCTGSTGQMDIKSSFFASMDVCGESGIKDTNKSMGWGFVTHTFKKDAGTGQWKFTVGTNPYQETFTIFKTCNCDVADDEPDEDITFRCGVVANGGVMFGAAQTEASIVFQLDDDATTCTASNP